jgi:hypothetical protein
MANDQALSWHLVRWWVDPIERKFHRLFVDSSEKERRGRERPVPSEALKGLLSIVQGGKEDRLSNHGCPDAEVDP